MVHQLQQASQAAKGELHLISDASETRYGAVAYVCWPHVNGERKTELLFTKARVAPFKCVSVPHIELTAAVIAVRISQQLRIFEDRFTFWNDSESVIHYVNNVSTRSSTLFSNRLRVLHEETKVHLWRYVKSADNPADYCSRGLRSLVKLSDWLSGQIFPTTASKDESTFCPPALTEDLLLDEKEASNDSGEEEPESGSDLFSCSIDWYHAFETMDFPTSSSYHRPDSFSVSQRYRAAPTRLNARPFLLRPVQTHDPPHEPPPVHSQRAFGHETSRSSQSMKLGSVSTKASSLDELPTETSLHIFRLLDDISLWALRRASFSVPCRLCLEGLPFPILFPVEAPNLRYRRIVHEIKNLCTDSPYGIRVLALDTEAYSYYLAGIEGPLQFPYQGGLFYVFHGDVGMDDIQHNWSLVLTLKKLLIGV
ncbi:unnamed protein product [Echinostoma caproni]|uniref:RT_RNaseH domain-containing protein n=1 Tax=Echinostoma caproni TaxID=27848 RepID=A0A183AT58_9TREM|nr:unnamed protein product [Echinostoma caproni]